MAHFVQLVPFGQLGEKFWGVDHTVNYLHVKIQNFIANIYQTFIDCNGNEVISQITVLLLLTVCLGKGVLV